MMGEGDAVRHLDAEDEAGRHRGGVVTDDVGPGQYRRVALEQRPEPLIDLDRGVTAAVLRQQVAALLPGIDQPFPGIVFPAAGADSDRCMGVHERDDIADWKKGQCQDRPGGRPNISAAGPCPCSLHRGDPSGPFGDASRAPAKTSRKFRLCHDAHFTRGPIGDGYFW